MPQPRQKTVCRAFLSILILLAILWEVSLAEEPGQIHLSLGTATKGGGFELFGRHVAQVINAHDPTLRVETIATKGSRQNLKLLEEGEIDLGLVEGNAARQALDGIGRSPSELKVLSVMYPNPGMFVVRADSPYRRIEDLKGKPVAFGTQASGLRILASDVLDGLGLDAERDFDQRILEKAADGPRLVLEHQVEALWGAGIGWPGFVKIAHSPGGARFIAPTPAQIEEILAKHPHLKPMSIPANTYQGQAGQIDSVGLWSLILIRPGLPDSVAYRVAGALHKGQEQLAKELKQGEYTTVQNTAAQVAAERLHPGVKRYICDAGVSGPPQERQ